MAASSEHIAQNIVEATEIIDPKADILTKLFIKLASNNMMERQDKKCLDLDQSFRIMLMSDACFRVFMRDACRKYAYTDYLNERVYHTKLDMADRISAYLESRSESQLGSHDDMMEIIAFIEMLVDYYWRLDHEDTISHRFADMFKLSQSSAIDKVSEDSRLFAYIRLAINHAMRSMHFDLAQYVSYTPDKLLIVIHLVSLQHMYLNTSNGRDVACFHLWYQLCKLDKLNDEHRQLIAASYKQAVRDLDIQSNSPLITSIDTLNDFIYTRVFITHLPESWRSGGVVNNFIDNMIAVFRDPKSPVMLDFFDNLSLEQYQALWERLLLKYNHSSPNLLNVMSVAPFWHALLLHGKTLIESNSEAGVEKKLQDFLTRLLYRQNNNTNETLSNASIVAHVWSLILQNPDLYVWFPSLLRMPTSAESNAPSTSTSHTSLATCQPIAEAMPSEQQFLFFNELLAALKTAGTGHLIDGLKDPSLVNCLGDNGHAIVTVGAIVRRAVQLKTIPSEVITSSIPSLKDFISGWTLQLVLFGRYQEVSQLALHQYLTWEVLSTLIQEKKLLELPGEKAPELIFGLCWSPLNNKLNIQPIFNDLVALIWSNEDYASYRQWQVLIPLQWQVLIPPTNCFMSTDTTGLSQSRPNHLHKDIIISLSQHYNATARQAFYAWWDSHKDNEVTMQSMPVLLVWLIGMLVIDRCNSNYSTTQNSQLLLTKTFWSAVHAKGGAVLILSLLLRISNLHALYQVLTEKYVQVNEVDLSFVDILFGEFEKEGHKNEFAVNLEKLLHLYHKYPEEEKARLLLLFLKHKHSDKFTLLAGCQRKLLIFLLNFEIKNKNDVNNHKLIEPLWRSLFGAISITYLTQYFDMIFQNYRQSFFNCLLFERCEIGLSVALETLQLHFGNRMWQQCQSLGRALTTSMDTKISESMFITLLSYADLDVLTRSVLRLATGKTESALETAIALNNDLGFMYLTCLFERYRVLHGDTDLTANPQKEVIRGFVYNRARPEVNSMTRSRNLLQIARLHQNIQASLWLFQLTKAIWDEVLFVGSTFVPYNIDVNHQDSIKQLNQPVQPQEKTILIEMTTQLIETEHPTFISFIDYIKQQPPAIPKSATLCFDIVQVFMQRPNDILANFDMHDAERWLGEAKGLAQSWRELLFMAVRYRQAEKQENITSIISPKALFGFIDAVEQELGQRIQLLDKCIVQLAHMPELRQGIVQQLSLSQASESSTPTLRQAMDMLLNDTKAVSQKAQTILRGVLFDADKVAKIPAIDESHVLVAADVDNQEVVISEPQVSLQTLTIVSNWETRFQQLIIEKHAFGQQSSLTILRQQPSVLTTMPSSSSMSPSSSLTTPITPCSSAMYGISASGASSPMSLPGLRSDHRSQRYK